MSHFTVTVRIPARVQQHQVKSYLEKMLEPYYEQGDADDYFMEFQDQTDEVHYEWNNKKVEQVELNGKLYYPWDRELLGEVNAIRTAAGDKPLERFGTSHPDPELNRAIKKAGGVVKEVPLSDIYESFDKYVKDYHGYRLNDQGQYGYYSNPNAKWDWWSIGGRWMGHWPAKDGADGELGQPGVFDNEPTEGGVDVIRIRDIDLARADEETHSVVQKFLKEYRAYYESGGEEEAERGHPFAGPRHDGLNVGLVNCLDEDEITDEMRSTCKLKKWDRRLDVEKVRYDVIKPLPEGKELEEFTQFLRDQFNRLRTYAYLDEKEGWVEPGEMGWWGVNDSTTESRKKYSTGFMPWLRGGNQDDWVVSVDCHI